MKTEKKILIAFLLNLSFSVFEMMGGLLTGSVAILSDSLHDLGDAISIGLSFWMEKKSKKAPDDRYTYGYVRYSALGGAITCLILLLGSVAVIGNAVARMIRPAELDGNGMMLLAAIGVVVNACAVFFTRGGGSLNQRAVNLHMLEDVLGWAAVLVGAIVLRWTGLSILDPLMSVGIAAFLLIHAWKGLREVLGLFLEACPNGIDLGEIRARLGEVDGVLAIHHLHVWSLDGRCHCATVHLVIEGDPVGIKERVRGQFRACGIGHVTLETEKKGESCPAAHCHGEAFSAEECHHHHHHHRHP